MLTAQVLRRATEALGLEVAQHELGILRADRLIDVDHVTAAENLDLHPLARAPGFDQLVDELFHCEIAVTRRLRIASPVARVPEWKHEMVHPSDPGPLITNAGGHTGAEHGHEHLVRLRRDIELAGQHLDDPATMRRMEEAAPGHAGAILGTGKHRSGPEQFGGAAHTCLR